MVDEHFFPTISYTFSILLCKTGELFYGRQYNYFHLSSHITGWTTELISLAGPRTTFCVSLSWIYSSNFSSIFNNRCFVLPEIKSVYRIQSRVVLGLFYFDNANFILIFFFLRACTKMLCHIKFNFCLSNAFTYEVVN